MDLKTACGVLHRPFLAFFGFVKKAFRIRAERTSFGRLVAFGAVTAVGANPHGVGISGVKLSVAQSVSHFAKCRGMICFHRAGHGKLLRDFVKALLFCYTRRIRIKGFALKAFARQRVFSVLFGRTEFVQIAVPQLGVFFFVAGGFDK